jgi:hypothetical protein
VRRRLLIAFLAAACLGASCSLLGGGEQPQPFPIPTTTSTPTADETLFAWMQQDGPCLFLIPKGGTGPSLLPIWAEGFRVERGARSSFLLYPVPLTGTGPIGISELMDLHGQNIETAPPDAKVLPECAKYPLFLVATAVSLD